jgi:hypothetical protein
MACSRVDLDGVRSLAAAERAKGLDVQVAASFRRNKPSIGFRGAEGPDAIQVDLRKLKTLI